MKLMRTCLKINGKIFRGSGPVIRRCESGKRSISELKYVIILLLIFQICACKKLVDVSAPITSTTSAIVYSSDATAISVLTGLYTNMNFSALTNPGIIPSLSLFAGLSADELTLSPIGYTVPLNAYYTNSLASTVSGYEYWSTIYGYIFTCNSAIENLNASMNVSSAVKQQLVGEAKFMRAFCYFYLVNLYGDVPLVLSTDYKSNAGLARSPKANVYLQIISDLKDAQKLLSSSYVDATLLKTTTERVRPTKWAAMALLARSYLYTENWMNAEAESDSIINNTAQFSLDTLNGVFLKNSTEAIWQLQPVTTGTTNTQDAVLFIIPSAGPSTLNPVYLSNNLVNSFEMGDNRKTNWIQSIKAGGQTYNYSYKYKVNARNASVTEYLMMLRLGEQFLIRSEALAQQGKTLASIADLNSIRNRAGLSNYLGATDKSSLLSAILHERQTELFTELGQRWLDIKRTGSVDGIMNIVTVQKGGLWNTNWQLYPIRITELQYDPELSQNVGY